MKSLSSSGRLVLLVLLFTLGCGGGSDPSGPGDNDPDPIDAYAIVPHLTVTRFTDVWGTGSGLVYASAVNAMLYRFDGTSWGVLERPQPRQVFGILSLNGVHVLPDGHVFAIGDDFAFRFDGTTWKTDDPTTSTVGGEGVFAVSANEAYAVGFQGKIYKWNGSEWTAMTSPTGQWLNDIHGVGGSLFAVGRGGTFLRFDGVSWQTLSTPTDQTLTGVWAATPNAVFAVGAAGTILRYDGSSVTAMTSSTDAVLFSVWGTSASSVYAAGGGVALRFNGTEWSEIASPSGSALGLWGTAGNDIHAASFGQGMERYDGTSWSTSFKNEDVFARAVFGFGPDDVFVASGRDMFHYDGTRLVKTDLSRLTTNAIFGMGGTSNRDLWAVGFDGNVLRYNGTAWGKVIVATDADFEAVWNSAPDDVFVVGRAGEIWHFDGTQWTDMESGTTQALFGVSGSGPNDVWAVGSAGTLLRYDGTQWVDQIAPTSLGFFDVVVRAPNDVYLLDFAGTVHHFDGIAWTSIPGGGDRELFVVSPTRIFTCGFAGVTRWYDGTRWNDLPSIGTGTFESVWASSASDVWMVGEDILQFVPGP
jgi:hypothetical protein